MNTSICYTTGNGVNCVLRFYIDEVLARMASEGRTHFSPHYVCTYIGVADLKSVTEYLLSLVGSKLKVYYEVECPDGDSDFIITSPKELSGQSRKCSYCGIEYTPSPDRIWIAFDFTDDYLEFIKKKTSGTLGITTH